MSIEGFQANPKYFNEIIHKLFYDTWVLYILFYNLTKILYLLFFNSCFSKLVSFTFDLVHLLSTWLTHSLIFPLYKLGTATTHPIRGGLLRTSFDSVVMLVRHPLNSFSLCWYIICFLWLLLFYISSFYFEFVNYFVFYLFSWVGRFIVFLWWWLVW